VLPVIIRLWVSDNVELLCHAKRTHRVRSITNLFTLRGKSLSIISDNLYNLLFHCPTQCSSTYLCSFATVHSHSLRSRMCKHLSFLVFILTFIRNYNIFSKSNNMNWNSVKLRREILRLSTGALKTHSSAQTVFSQHDCVAQTGIVFPDPNPDWAEWSLLRKREIVLSRRANIVLRLHSHGLSVILLRLMTFL
jgi:hypothetical protein